MHDQLPAVIAKIARMLAIRPEYFVTHPSELRVVRALSLEQLGDVARQNGWRVVRRPHRADRDGVADQADVEGLLQHADAAAVWPGGGV